MTKITELIDEIISLELENRPELKNQITQSKTEPLIDEGCVGCCKVVDIAAGLQKKVDPLEEHAGVKDTVIALAMKRIAEQKTTLTEKRNRISTLHGLIIGLEAKIESIRNEWLLSCDDVHALEAELYAREQDSEVLGKVVDAIARWNRSPIEPRRTICDIRMIIDDCVDKEELNNE